MLHKGAQLDYMLVSNTSRKPHWESIATIRSDLVALKVEVISRKGAELGHMQLLNTNKKPCVGNSITPPDLTFSSVEMSNLGAPRFCILIHLAEETRPYDTSNTDRNAYI